MMKKQLVSSLFLTVVYVMFLVGLFYSGPVYAQDTATPLPTITITAPPPYVPSIVTPTFPVDFSCPTGMPEGYGYVTPDSTWNLLCSQCLTTAFPTSTYVPTGTGTPGPTVTGTPPTSTPSPTATVTATPTSIFSGYAFEVVDAPIVVRNAPYATDSGSDVSCFPSVGSTGVNIVSCTGTLWGNGSNPFVAGGMAVSLELLADNYPNTWYYEGEITNSSAVGDIVWREASLSGPIVSTSTVTSGDYYNGASANGGLALEVYITTGSTGSFWAEYDFTMSTSPLVAVPTPTPTVTPTLPAGSYCDVIHDDAEYGFSWTGITTGDTYCMDIGPYEGWDFGGLTTPPILGYPWIAHICLQDIDIGVLTVFAVEISLATIVYVLGIIAIIRTLFVS